MALRKLAKRIPGARRTYIALMRAGGAVRRRLVGPNRGERYDIETAEVLSRVLSRDSVCVDLGAHNGEILKLMVQFAPSGTHHAVEALPHYAERLIKQFTNVVVHSCAAADKTGEATFNYVMDHPAYSGLQQRAYPRNDCEIRVITVPVQRLDDLVPGNLVARVIKADIEGGEYHAFCGARQLIKRSNPVIIFEFGKGGAGYYGISPQMMHSLLHDEFGLNISTMRRWLQGQPPLTFDEFANSFENNIDVYFMAYPNGEGRRRD
jgi:FkbM family methyltransferase